MNEYIGGDFDQVCRHIVIAIMTKVTFVLEILHRFHYTSETFGEIHAQGQKQYEVQDMASGGIDTVRIFDHDFDRF